MVWSTVQQLKFIIDQSDFSDRTKDFVKLIVDCEEYCEEHFEDNETQSIKYSHESFGLYEKLISYSFESIHSIFQELKSDYHLHHVCLLLYQDIWFRLSIIIMSAVEDIINEKLYRESATAAFDDNMINTIGIQAITAMDKKKEKWYNKEFSDYLWFSKTSVDELKEFHQDCVNAGSLIILAHSNKKVAHILQSKQTFIFFLQLYDRRITYTFDEDQAIHEKMKILELMCYNCVKESMLSQNLSYKHRAGNYMYWMANLITFIIEKPIDRKYERIIRLLSEWIMKFYYDVDTCKYNDYLTDVINKWDKEDKTLMLRSKIKKILSKFYEYLYLNKASYMQPGFLGNHPLPFTFREHKLWLVWCDAIDREQDASKARMYFDQLQRHAWFFRMEFNTFGIKFYELKHILLADLAGKATSKWFSKVNDKLIEELKTLFHERNAFIVENYPVAEIEDKLKAIQGHADEINSLAGLNLEIVKIE